ncbi:MAG TPA: nuclear transport factor 2 family protein [Acidimicrobiales bacterium]|nr:nuclear transport factor 2 family protein [Acidimicrobiales bacterium]
MTPEDLVEIEAIKRVKYKYVRCLDQKLWDEIVDCFTEDAVAAYSGGKYHFEGRDAIVAFLVESMGAEDFLSAHRVTQPEIDLVGTDRATGTWGLVDEVLVKQHSVRVRGAAFYSDEYVKVGGQWRIARTGYTRTYEEFLPL